MPQIFSNHARTTLSAPLTVGATSASVASSADFPALDTYFNDWEMVTLEAGETREIVRVTARAGTTWTVERAQEGTEAQAWPAGTLVEARVTAGTLAGMWQRGTTVPDATAFGDRATAVATSAAYGSDARAQENGVAVGPSAEAASNGCAVGVDALAAENSVAVGYGAYIVLPEGQGNATALGSSTQADAEYAVALGSGVQARRASQLALGAIPAIPAEWTGFIASRNPAAFYIATPVVLASATINLAAASVAVLEVPAGLRLYMEEAGLWLTAANTVTAGPVLRLGTDASTPEDVLAASAVTLTALHQRQRWTPLTPDQAVTQVRIEVATPATATAMVGRVYLRGVVIEDQDL